MKRILTLVLATVALAGFAQTAQAATPTPTPTPANMHVVANADESIPGFVILAVTVSNSGQTPSGLVSLIMTLPPHLWTLSEESWSEGDCSLADNVLTGSGYIEARHINDAQTDFENGQARCVVVAQVAPCGSYSASPYIIHAGEEQSEIIAGNTASWSRACPAPVPTATPVPPTPTATPVPPTLTNTAIPPTPTPAVIVVTATPTATPFRIAPLPPNTGTGSDGGTPLFTGVLLILAVFIATPLALVLTMRWWERWLRE